MYDNLKNSAFLLGDAVGRKRRSILLDIQWINKDKKTFMSIVSPKRKAAFCLQNLSIKSHYPSIKYSHNFRSHNFICVKMESNFGTTVCGISRKYILEELTISGAGATKRDASALPTDWSRRDLKNRTHPVRLGASECECVQ